MAKATDWTAVTAWAAWATVTIYIVLGIFAWIQVLQARKLRKEQARPFVVVDFEAGFLVYLTVENIGRTMARDVTIRFDKPLESTLSRPREIDETPLFREPIPTLPPGKKIRVLFDSYVARFEASLPLTYDVMLRYKGPTGRKEWEHPYRLDLNMYLGSAEPPKGLPELVAEVEKIRKEMEKWRVSGRGLRVQTVDQRRQQRREWRRHHVVILRRQGLRALVRSLWGRALWRSGLR
ncbi:MAG TPA: hypothetical protein VGQ69_02915 [Gemmatimonadales bacterium]|jgi:hypothetical protein|nr:hypothetical protein [Gemmatimonadales bacterium]